METALAVPGAIRTAPARHEGGERARRRHQYAAARPGARAHSWTARAPRSVIRSKSSPASRKRASSTSASRTRCRASRAGGWWSTSAAAAPKSSSAKAMHAKKLESLYMGCVSMSSRFFDDGEITEKRMKRARLAARLELEPVRATFKNYGWDQAVGSSGHDPLGRRRIARAQQRRRRDHAGGSRVADRARDHGPATCRSCACRG